MIDQLNFTSRFLQHLPVDPSTDNICRQVFNACASKVVPTPVAAPKIIAWSHEVATLLGLPSNPEDWPELPAVLGGNQLASTMTPFAACYGGHQFGSWARQLGDGRAITLGELEGPDTQRWELQLKGAGPTPYSRRADGRAVLRSSIREFLCSEAMHHLGVPTTRALSLVQTGDQVMRDMFYDGHPAPEPGAIVCRVAPSFIRFGNFEIFAAREDIDTLKKLTNFTIETYFPELGAPCDDVYVAFFTEVCRRTALMIAHWMRVGFVHGVMNTDNMSILGLTIDYGPYGWIDNYDPNWTPNTTDAQGRRYRFGHQPGIAAWNLQRLAVALAPLLDNVEPFAEALEEYGKSLEKHIRTMFAAKIGLTDLGYNEDDEDPKSTLGLVNELQQILYAAPTDMTLFHRALADISLDENVSDTAILEVLRPAYYNDEELSDALKTRTLTWVRQLHTRVRSEGTGAEQRKAAMNAVNPMYVMRNYLAQLAIDEAEKGDPTMVMELLDCMRSPYTAQPGRERFAEKRPEWAKNRPGCSMLSCSS